MNLKMPAEVNQVKATFKTPASENRDYGVKDKACFPVWRRGMSND